MLKRQKFHFFFKKNQFWNLFGMKLKKKQKQKQNNKQTKQKQRKQ